MAETLPHPNCYLVFEHNLEESPDSPSVLKQTEVSGVATGKFTRRMEGWGRVFGLKFKPGGLRPFLGAPVSTLTDRILPAEQIFGPSVHSLAAQLRGLHDAAAMVEATVTFFRASTLPQADANVLLSTRLVELILSEPAILTVNALATRAGLGVRSLERLFREYVGVSPKWVICRYRLHELLERLHNGEAPNIAQLACELGYADQAHLSNDFRRLAGCTPQQYRQALRSAQGNLGASN